MLNVVAEPVYLCRPLSLAEMTAEQMQLAADQLREFAVGELAFIERELAEIGPLRADTFTDWERKQTKLAEIQAEKWRWLGFAQGSEMFVATEWPWGYLEARRNAPRPVNKKNKPECQDTWRDKAREIGRNWMLEQEQRFGERPSREAIAERLEGMLFELKIYGPRGPLTAENILREALIGITKD
ncbi:hypothetical protein [Methylomonas sp. DH-1]|uniref:hypothetical protein n=1 Tax=Methylomonas sp. (strain DH-1) TaxID=1727196 RepID=UPI000B188E98|nr:hypothetical protein [Methylomonas sp. DH-1]